MKVLILGAGYGTRLYPLTLNKPKALLEVGGKVILERVLGSIFLIKECDGIYIVTNAKFFAVFKDWVNNKNFGNRINVLNDGTSSNDDRLGAIGDIDFTINKGSIDDDVLVLGSDNLYNFRMRDFVDFAKSKKPCASLALHDVGDLEKARLYGIAVLKEGSSEIIDFEEKPKMPKSTLAATAVYFYPKEKVKLIREYMKSSLTKDAPGNFIKWLKTKEPVYGFVFKEKWYDIGDKESLKKADSEYRRKEKGKQHDET